MFFINFRVFLIMGVCCIQAVEFVTMQHDDDLWEELIKQCLHKPEMVY